MLGIVRNYDKAFGVCKKHKSPRVEIGYVLSSQMKVIVNGLPSVRMFDTVISGCGAGRGVIIKGSGKIICSGRPIARRFDNFVGTYTGYIIGGSGNVLGV